MAQLQTPLCQEASSLEAAHNQETCRDDISESSGSTDQDQNEKDLLWREKIRHNLSSTSIGKRKAYRNRILLVGIIIAILATIAAGYV